MLALTGCTMIYTPANLRISNGFAIFESAGSQAFIIRQANIESVRVRYIEIDKVWELTIRTSSCQKHHLVFSEVGDVVQRLLSL